MDHLSLDDLDDYPHASVFEDSPKTVRLALDAGEGVAAHSHPGKDVLIVVLEGTVEVTLDGDSVTAEEGDVVRFDGEREVAPEAVTDARALVVLAHRADAD
jgi:quercetin dioxygenase-like cupin family protein